MTARDSQPEAKANPESLSTRAKRLVEAGERATLASFAQYAQLANDSPAIAAACIEAVELMRRLTSYPEEGETSARWRLRRQIAEEAARAWLRKWEGEG